MNTRVLLPTNEFLQEQFHRCESWNDPEQWEYLADLYVSSGYAWNGAYCLRQADACRTAVTVETADQVPA